VYFVDKISARRLVGRRTNWLNPVGRDSDIILSTRCAVSRNMKGFRFPFRADDNELNEVFIRISRAVELPDSYKDGSIYPLRNVSDIAKFVLLERRIISPEMAHTDKPGVAAGIFKGEELSFSVNDEDHFRVQAIISGMEADVAFTRVTEYMNKFRNRLSFVHSGKLGWLTSSPTKIGTGLQLSFFCHLPALILCNRMERVFKRILPASINIRGLFSEGNHQLGNMFQISNQATLGTSEEDIIQKTTSALNEVVKEERDCRNKLKKNNNIKAVDRVQRSIAVLKNARLMGAMEMISYISDLRFGLALGWVKGIDFHSLNKLLLSVLPGHLLAKHGYAEDVIEQDKIRADILRQGFSNVNPV